MWCYVVQAAAMDTMSNESKETQSLMEGKDGLKKGGLVSAAASKWEFVKWLWPRDFRLRIYCAVECGCLIW
jgi:hypothetical protein